MELDPNGSEIRGVDVSEFTLDIPRHWWEWLYGEHGVSAAVIQAWGGGPRPGRRNDLWAQQARGAVGAGLQIAAYVWPSRSVGAALAYMRGSDRRMYELTRFVALDVEAGAGVSHDDVVAVTGAGKVPYIYASPGGWGDIMGGSTAFSNLPLWLAGYREGPGGDGYYRVRWAAHGRPESIAHGESHYLPMGGWRHAAGWQFTGTARLVDPHGHVETADLNMFKAEAFRPRDDGGDMAELERLLREHSQRSSREHERAGQLRIVEGVFQAAAGFGAAGQELPIELVRVIRALIRGYPA